MLIKTADKPLVMTKDSNVQIQLVGAKGSTQVFSLLSPYVNLFETNQMDAFLIMSSTDLGKPEKLRLAHNIRPLSRKEIVWTIENIKVIYSKDPNKFYVFKVDKWLDKNNKLNAIIVPDTVAAIEQGTSDPSQASGTLF